MLRERAPSWQVFDRFMFALGVSPRRHHAVLPLQGRDMTSDIIVWSLPQDSAARAAAAALLLQVGLRAELRDTTPLGYMGAHHAYFT